MKPYFVVTPDVEEGELPQFAVVERIVQVVDGDTYVCRMVKLPWCHSPWREVAIRLEGLGDPANVREALRAQSVKAYVERHLTKSENIALRNIRRGADNRLLADLHADFCNLPEFLAEALASAR